MAEIIAPTTIKPNPTPTISKSRLDISLKTSPIYPIVELIISLVKFIPIVPKSIKLKLTGWGANLRCFIKWGVYARSYLHLNPKNRLIPQGFFYLALTKLITFLIAQKPRGNPITNTIKGVKSVKSPPI